MLTNVLSNIKIVFQNFPKKSLEGNFSKYIFSFKKAFKGVFGEKINTLNQFGK